MLAPETEMKRSRQTKGTTTKTASTVKLGVPTTLLAIAWSQPPIAWALSAATSRATLYLTGFLRILRIPGAQALLPQQQPVPAEAIEVASRGEGRDVASARATNLKPGSTERFIPKLPAFARNPELW